MRVRALDANGDWTWGKGRNNYLSGKPARAQALMTGLMSFQGDCFWDLARGQDWWNLLGSKNPLAIDYTIQAFLTNEPEVASVKKRTFDLNPNTRRFESIYDVSIVAESPAELTPDLSLSTTRLLTELGDILTTEAGDPIGI